MKNIKNILKDRLRISAVIASLVYIWALLEFDSKQLCNELSNSMFPELTMLYVFFIFEIALTKGIKLHKFLIIPYFLLCFFGFLCAIICYIKCWLYVNGVLP